MTDKVSFRAVVSGRVQGVFFRMFVMREANALRLCGRVKNLRDGSVEVLAEGERAGLETLIQRLHKGPPAASVQNVAVDWGDYLHEYDDFQMDYS
jgi:acylphosphatase